MPEVSRLEVWDMSELGCKTTVAEVPEVPRLERAMLSKDATVVELETMVSQVQLPPSVPREMARTEASVTCLGWLRRYCQCRHDNCEQYHRAHRALLIGQAAQPGTCLIGSGASLSCTGLHLLIHLGWAGASAMRWFLSLC